MFKKISSIIVSIAIFLGMTACSMQGGESGSGEKIKVVCTTFPQYDWTREIIEGLEEDFELTLLVDTGIDIHSFQPSAGDIIDISSCDLLINIGGVSDSWAAEAAVNSNKKDIRVLNMLDILGNRVREERLLDGMEAHHEDHDETENPEGHEDEHETEGVAEQDEHVWLSLKNAVLVCNAIAEELAEIDIKNQEHYQKNAEEYIGRLNDLDGKYQEAVGRAQFKTVVFADRFPFLYMMEDYNLKCFAAFPGCSAETEASFETVVFLANKLNEENLPAVLMIDGGNRAMAETVVGNSARKNQKIISLNSLQSITQGDMSAGKTYLSIMEENLNGLRQAIGG